MFESSLLSDTHHFANNPAVAAKANDELSVAWVRHFPEKGDEIVVFNTSHNGIEVITPHRGQYLRPVIAYAGNRIHCVWTQTEHDRPSTIWYSVRGSDGWSPPTRLLPEEARAHQNPEIASSAEGRIAVAFQLHTGEQYEIFVKDRRGTHAVSRGTKSTNTWDPTITFLNESWHLAWSNFFEGDYDIYYQREKSKKSPQRISSRGQYDLHPWIAASPEDNLWVTWDAVELPGHANSGSTTINGANPQHKIPSNYGAGQQSWIEVRVIDDDGNLRTPG